MMDTLPSEILREILSISGNYDDLVNFRHVNKRFAAIPTIEMILEYSGQPNKGMVNLTTLTGSWNTIPDNLKKITRITMEESDVSCLVLPESCRYFKMELSSLGCLHLTNCKEFDGGDCSISILDVENDCVISRINADMLKLSRNNLDITLIDSKILIMTNAILESFILINTSFPILVNPI